MLSFRVDGYQFQVRAAAVVVDGEFVLLHRAEMDDFWALPGGRVTAGEDAASTVVREMLEEASEPVECGNLRFVVETFFDYQGARYHEVGFYFRVKLSAESRLLDKTRSHFGREEGQVLEFRWFRTDELGALDVRPRCLRECVAQSPDRFYHLVERR